MKNEIIAFVLWLKSSKCPKPPTYFHSRFSFLSNTVISRTKNKNSHFKSFRSFLPGIYGQMTFYGNYFKFLMKNVIRFSLYFIIAFLDFIRKVVSKIIVFISFPVFHCHLRKTNQVISLLFHLFKLLLSFCRRRKLRLNRINLYWENWIDEMHEKWG